MGLIVKVEILLLDPFQLIVLPGFNFRRGFLQIRLKVEFTNVESNTSRTSFGMIRLRSTFQGRSGSINVLSALL
jgi:hypothetical protein